MSRWRITYAAKSKLKLLNRGAYIKKPKLTNDDVKKTRWWINDEEESQGGGLMV
jgi:hypothetical protein